MTAPGTLPGQLSDMADTSREAIDSDVAYLFGYSSASTHQERCHEYLMYRGLSRTGGEPATLRAVRDLVERARNVGRDTMREEAVMAELQDTLCRATSCTVELRGMR